VSWTNAKRIAEDWAAQSMRDDMRGHALQMPSFQSDEACRFYYSDRDLSFHRMITNAIARIARKRGAVEIIWTPVTIDSFESSESNDPAQFIQACYRILPKANV
jgi:hypothetical protein